MKYIKYGQNVYMEVEESLKNNKKTNILFP